MNIDDLKAPIGVFDAGLGSYAAAEKIRRSHPQQDIVYLADRASFPYGSKSKSELSAAVFSAISFLARVGCSAVVLASNAPSVMVLEELRHSLPVPVLGVYPPIALAIKRSLSKQVGILGVASLVESLEMKEFLKQHGYGGSLSVFNASPLVALVEDGSFLTEKEATQNAVRLFLESCWSEKPELDTFTLSSTHLPWLLGFFQKAAPGVTFLDPVDDVLCKLDPWLCSGRGITVCLATESSDYPLTALSAMLDRMGITLSPQKVVIEPATVAFS